MVTLGLVRSGKLWLSLVLVRDLSVFVAWTLSTKHS